MKEETILVIEDNELNMKLVRRLLKMGRYGVLEAVDAERGLSLVREHKPDLILMDIQLPGMDGLSATRIIREDPALKDTPVVALTGHAMQGDDQKAREAGCAGYISKPIDTRNFLKTVAQFLNHDGHEKECLPGKDMSYKNRILIVDDDPLNVKLLAAKLPSGTYETILAYNGEKALEKVAGEFPDLVLLDIMMPGIDGYEVTRRLKNDSKTRDIPIILVTALDGADDKAKGLKAGADEFLNKPVNTAELQARVNSLLSLKQYRDQLETRTQSENFFKAPLIPEESTRETKGLPSILLVEDNEKDAKLIQCYLQAEPCRVELVSKGEETIARAKKGQIDLVLLDILLPDMDGFEICRRLKETEQTRNIQIIMITCLQDLESKIKGIELGADDFLVKPINRHELKARVHALVKKKAYLDRLSANYETALHSAITDKLTGLYNQAYLKHFLELEVKRSLRQRYPVSLIMIDIDDFKQYNDTLGHLAGDRILREFGQLIKKTFREVDLAARYGGDEFVMALPYIDKKEALLVAERFKEVINAHSFFCETSLSSEKLTASMGVAGCPSDAKAVEELIQKADRALYNSKHKGKNRACLYNENLRIKDEG